MRRPRVVAAATYVVGLALFVLFVAIPSITKDRSIPAEVPSPPALRELSLVQMAPGARTCMSDLAISKESRRMAFKVSTNAKPGPALRVSVRAPGYGMRATVPAGYGDDAQVSVAVPAPASSRLATVCIRNAGRTKIALFAAADSAHSRVRTAVDGRPEYATPALSFAEANPVSLQERAGVTAGRIAVFRGFLDHAWVVWLLALAMVVGVPVLVGVALAVSGRQLRSDSSGE